jgi:hypothetical protein
MSGERINRKPITDDPAVRERIARIASEAPPFSGRQVSALRQILGKAA